MTSVVQIITKRASPTSAPEVSGSVEGGSFGTFRGTAGVYGGTGAKVDYRAAITSRKTNGAFSDLLPEDDRYTQTAFDGGVGIAIGSSASARGGLRYSDGNGKVVGPVNYGARDTGTAYQTRDLTAYGAISPQSDRGSPAAAAAATSAIAGGSRTPSTTRSPHMRS